MAGSITAIGMAPSMPFPSIVHPRPCMWHPPGVRRVPSMWRLPGGRPSITRRGRTGMGIITVAGTGRPTPIGTTTAIGGTEGAQSRHALAMWSAWNYGS